MMNLQRAIVLLLVLAACGFVFFRSSQPPSLESAIALREDVTSSLAVSGVLESVDRTTVASQLAGARVSKVLVDIGDSVEQGQALVEFDRQDLEAQRDAADAQIAQSEAQAQLQAQNQLNAERALKVARVAESDPLELRLALTNAETNLETAKQRVRQAEANLARVKSGGRAELVRQARAQFERAIVMRDQKKRDAARSKALFDEGAVSQSALEQAEAALATSEKEVEIARESVALAESNRTEDVRQAEAQLDEARASQQGASRSVALAKRNYEQRLAARQQVISAETQRDSARASIQVSEATRRGAVAARNTAESNLAKTVVRAPFAGKVSQRMIEPGQTVGVGTSLLMIANPERLRVKLDVDESSLEQIRIGAEAVVSFDAFPELKLSARVSEIGSAANFQRGTVEVRLELQKGDARLKPELTVDANLIVGRYSDAIVIPRRAILNPTDNPEVYVVKNGVVDARKITWTRGSAENAVIRTGLEAGERVLLEPRLTKPGSRVNAIAARKESGGR